MGDMADWCMQVDEAIINTPKEKKKEGKMKELLRELVEVQKEANKINRAVLSVWSSIEDGRKADAAHRLCSTLASMKYLRDDYTQLVSALEQDVDNEDIQRLIDDLCSIFGGLLFEAGSGKKVSFTLPSSKELLEKFKKKAGKE